MLDYRAISPWGEILLSLQRVQVTKKKSDSTVHTIFKNNTLKHLVVSDNSLSVCVRTCVCRWTEELLMVTRIRFPIIDSLLQWLMR